MKREIVAAYVGTWVLFLLDWSRFVGKAVFASLGILGFVLIGFFTLVL